MKKANVRVKIKYLLIFICVCIAAAFSCIATSLMAGKTVDAAGSVKFTSYCSVSQIKTNATDTEFVVYGVVSENEDSLYGVDFQINIDPEIFEFKAFMTPAEIATAVGDSTLSNTLRATESAIKHTTSSVVCSVDNYFQPITVNSFVVSGYKIGLKDGATLPESYAITVTGIKIASMIGQPVPYTEEGTSMTISFVDPSEACDLTNLTSTQSGVTITKDGDSYKATVTNSISTLSAMNLKPTVSDGATVTYSPNGSLSVGDNTITITVTAEDGEHSKTYSLTVTRSESDTSPTTPGGSTNPNETNTPDENGGLFKPTLRENPTFTGSLISVADLLDGYNSNYMELSLDTSATKVGEYQVTITLLSTDYFWKDNTANAAVVLGAVVLLADGDSITLNWEIQPYTIPASSWTDIAGEPSKLEGVPADILGYITYTYTDKDGNVVTAEEMVEGETYTVTTSVQSGFEDSIILSETTHSFTYAKAASWTDFFTQQLFGLAVWIWILIALAVLLFLILLIVLIARHRKKKKAENAEDEKLRREEEREEKRRRREEEREEEKRRREDEREEAKRRREEELEEKRYRREEERQDRLAAQDNRSTPAYNAPVSMPMGMGGVMPLGMQQPAPQPIVVGSPSSEQLSDIKQELRDLKQAVNSQSAAQPVVAQPVTPAPQPVPQPVPQPIVLGSPSSEQYHELKQELRDLRDELKSQAAHPIAPQPMPQPVQPQVVISERPAHDSVSAEQIKDEVKSDLKEDFGHKERVERLLETIATSREHDRQKFEQEEQERNERMQSLEARRKERLDAITEFHHAPPFDPSADKIRDLEGKLHSMEELMWMMRFGGMPQMQPPQQPAHPQLASGKDERVLELEAKLRDMEMKQENEKRFHEWETKQQELRFREMELNQREMRIREDEEKRFREMEQRLRSGYPLQAEIVTVQPQPQKPIQQAHQNESVATKPAVVVQQPATQSVPHTVVQPGSVMTTTTTTTIDATKDAKADELPELSSRFVPRRRNG